MKTARSPKIITLKAAAEMIGLTAKRLREKALQGDFPSTVIKKVGGRWYVNIEEWDRWHQNQI